MSCGSSSIFVEPKEPANSGYPWIIPAGDWTTTARSGDAHRAELVDPEWLKCFPDPLLYKKIGPSESSLIRMATITNSPQAQQSGRGRHNVERSLNHVVGAFLPWVVSQDTVFVTGGGESRRGNVSGATGSD